MTAHLGFNLRIRTEQSEECSGYGSQFAAIEHSIESISIADESVTMHIQHLQKMEEEMKQKSKKTISSRSHSYIYVHDEENEEKKKSKSMKNNTKSSISLENIPHANMTQLLSYHRCPNLSKNDIHNRAYGAMFGFLIGDSIGSYIVNKSFDQEQILNALMMKGGGVMNLKSGQGTDEWEICLSLSEALIESNGVYNSNKIAQKYLEWIDSSPFDLPVLMGIAFSDIKKKRHSHGKLDLSTLGEQLKSGSLRNIKYESVLGLTRIIPLAIWGLKLQQYQFNHIIKQQMKFITPNEFVVETSIIFANLIKCIILTGDHMLAYHQASQNVYKFGSEKMIQLWNCIEENRQLAMSNSTANNLKFPLVYAVNELLEIDEHHKDLKKSFIQSTIRILSKGFNTDTNCSIVLSLIGAIIGYNNIPSYFRSRIINSECQSQRIRNKNFDSKRIVNIVSDLIKEGPSRLQTDI